MTDHCQMDAVACAMNAGGRTVNWNATIVRAREMLEKVGLNVDPSMVGEVRIIGSYVNKTILDAISRGVISAAITVDTSAIGRSAAAALDQFVTTGSVSDFVTLDASAVTQDNVKEYIKNEP